MLVAHRAGNEVATIAAAADAGANWIEVDVHALRGRLQVRHEKALLWSARWFYEGRRIMPAFECADLSSVWSAVPGHVGVLVALKGFRPALTRAVLEARVGEHPMILSSRQWYLLRGVPAPDVLRCWSVGNRVQRWLAPRLSRTRWVDAVAIHSRLVEPRVVRRLRERLSYVLAWSVRDAQHASRLIESGVNGLIVDDLELIRHLASR
jgi:glycerophosphoryl diester phosphodiesterase